MDFCMKLLKAEWEENQQEEELFKCYIIWQMKVAMLHSNGQLRTERDGDAEKGRQEPAVQQKTTDDDDDHPSHNSHCPLANTKLYCLVTCVNYFCESTRARRSGTHGLPTASPHTHEPLHQHAGDCTSIVTVSFIIYDQLWRTLLCGSVPTTDNDNDFIAYCSPQAK